MAELKAPPSITLPGQPSCRTVYISTSRKSACIDERNPQAYWSVNSIDIADVEQYAPRTRKLSQGSDSSRDDTPESTVVALAWSHPGLGVGGRPVLAVLTSNLVLSIWETDGTPKSWRRTLMLNSSLDLDREEKFGLDTRPGTGVRGFCWFPPLLLGSPDEYGSHYIVTVDSCGALIIFYMDLPRTDINQWVHDPAFHDDLDAPQELFSARDAATSSPGQPQAGPLVAITVEDWQYPSAKVGEPQKAITKVHLRYRHDAHCDMSYHVRALYDNKPTFLLPDLRLWGTEIRSCGADYHANPSFSGFEAALADIQTPRCHEVRRCGTSYSSDRKMQAACVTFCASDVIEDISQSSCAIVFAKGGSLAAPAPPLKSLRMVQQGVISYAVERVGDGTIKTKLILE